MKSTALPIKNKILISNAPLNGKASVKHFLNTKLKPNKGLLGIKEYPVYMRVVFNRKSTNIKSDFNYFDTESVQEERDIFDHLKYNALYSGGGPYLSEKDFSSARNTIAFNEEARVVSEIVQFYGRYGVNILLDNPGELIIYGLKFIRRILSDKLNEDLRSSLATSDLQELLNSQNMFDKQFEALKRYGNEEVLEAISPFIKEYEITQLLKKVRGIRVYEWIHNDIKGQFIFKFGEHQDLILKLQEAISLHFKKMLFDNRHARLYQLIKADI